MNTTSSTPPEPGHLPPPTPIEPAVAPPAADPAATIEASSPQDDARQPDPLDWLAGQVEQSVEELLYLKTQQEETLGGLRKQFPLLATHEGLVAERFAAKTAQLLEATSPEQPLPTAAELLQEVLTALAKELGPVATTPGQHRVRLDVTPNGPKDAEAQAVQQLTHRLLKLDFPPGGPTSGSGPLGMPDHVTPWTMSRAAFDALDKAVAKQLYGF